MIRAAPKRPWLVEKQTIILFVLVFALSMILWVVGSPFFFPWQEPPLRVWALDVGQGDAFFIQFPDGTRWLIDGGPDDSVLVKLGSILPPWDRSLDAILLTHPDADHITGLVSVLDRYRVSVVYETGARAHTPPAQAFVDRLTREGADHELLQTGDRLEIAGVNLTVLWPDESQEGIYPEERNNLSINLLIEYGGTRMLLTGDAEASVEEMVGPRAGDIDILKVGHHGSLTSTSWSFLEHTKPEIALISSGRDNPYGHPHPVIVERLFEHGTAVYRTDLHGDLLVVSDGSDPEVRPSSLPF